jgi:uncharacterized protein
MSERDNTQLVQQIYERIAAGDIEPALAHFAEDVEWCVPAMDNVPFSGVWKGRDGVRDFFRRLAEVHEVVEFVPEEFVARDHAVIVLGRFVMRVRTTDATVASRWAHAWTIEAGRITHFREYVDTAAVSRAHSRASVARRAL